MPEYPREYYSYVQGITGRLMVEMSEVLPWLRSIGEKENRDLQLAIKRTLIREVHTV